MRRIALAAAVAALAVGASGCGGEGTLTPQPKAAAAAKSPFAGHELSGPATAADFALRDQDGRLIRLSAQHGKLVLLTFLYTHCTDICPLIANQLNQALREMYHQRSSVRVLAVSVDANEQLYKRFMNQFKVAYATSRDPSWDIAATYGTFQLPESYIIDSSGKVVQKVIAAQNWMNPDFVQSIKKML